jgi:hypothetical protein
MASFIADKIVTNTVTLVRVVLSIKAHFGDAMVTNHATKAYKTVLMDARVGISYTLESIGDSLLYATLCYSVPSA